MPSKLLRGGGGFARIMIYKYCRTLDYFLKLVEQQHNDISKEGMSWIVALVSFSHLFWVMRILVKCEEYILSSQNMIHTPSR